MAKSFWHSKGNCLSALKCTICIPIISRSLNILLIVFVLNSFNNSKNVFFALRLFLQENIY